MQAIRPSKDDQRPPSPVRDALERLGRMLEPGSAVDDRIAPPAESHPAVSTEWTPRLPHMAEVADYLREHGLQPLPVHYASAWVALGGPVSEVPAPAPVPAPPTASDLCAQTLDRLIVDAQGTLAGLSTLIARSRADASAYGDALATGAATLESPNDALDVLMSLTRTMIDRTREADQRMREMDSEMHALHGHLVEARTVATRDSLTGLDNRRAIETQLDAAIANAEGAVLEGDGDPPPALALAYCDIDHFKSINDRLGHDVGDRVLKLVARILADGTGTGGRAARYGGEEFVIMFDGVSLDEAEDRIDTVRRRLAARTLRVRDTGDAIGTVTFSGGLCAWRPGEDRDMLLRRADEALYRAKGLGRNRIERGRGEDERVAPGC